MITAKDAKSLSPEGNEVAQALKTIEQIIKEAAKLGETDCMWYAPSKNCSEVVAETLLNLGFSITLFSTGNLHIDWELS